MCRMLALVGPVRKNTKIELFKAFRQQADGGMVPPGFAPGHKDGWGSVAYFSNGKICLIKSAKNASQDQQYVKMIGKFSAQSSYFQIIHLRKASVGKISINNSHPFLVGRSLFCQNGTVFSLGEMEVGKEFAKKIKGDTDSERVFAYLLEKLNGKKITKKNLITALRDLKKEHDYTALNFFFFDRNNLWVLRDYNNRNELVRNKKLSLYYSLYEGRIGRSRIFSSEKINYPGVHWKLFANKELKKVVVFRAGHR